MIYRFKTLLSILFIFLLSSSYIHAQINVGGTPFSFKETISLQSQNIPIVKMEHVDVDALLKEDMKTPEEPQPMRFGQNLDVNINPDNAGVWEEMHGHNVWRVGISSPGAVSINLKFDDYHVPEGARLFIYSADRTDVIGAFTSQNNQIDRVFATGLVFSDTIYLEYIEPLNPEFKGSLNLSRVTHGYRSVGEYGKAFGDSGSCNLNVACPESDGWEEQIRSVALIITGGSKWCTGALINNTQNDGKPLFLSANHCYRDPSSLVYWFNWQSETCQNPSTSPSRDVVSGSVTRMRHSPSDVWLLEFNQDIPLDYEVYYSGWNRTDAASIDGYIAGIHHPRGDIKKFSYSNDGVVTASYLGGPNSGTTHWRVTWDGGTTTEPGSSGSPIFDSNQRIIGQLHGGYAACGNTQPDWYGRMNVSWTGGGTPATRLSDWLDPLGTGAMEMDGFDPLMVDLPDTDAQLAAIVSPSGSYSSGDEITPVVRIRNRGENDITEATVSYTINNGLAVSVNWTGTLESFQTAEVEFPSFTAVNGTYEFTATVDVAGDEDPENDSMTTTFIVADEIFFEDFDESDGLPEGWTITDNEGNNQTWVVGQNGTRGLPASFGNYAYLDSDAFGSGNSQDSDIISPALDLSDYDGITLEFDHYFRQWQSSVASVHFSIDNGSTWTQIAEWTSTTSNPQAFAQVIEGAAGHDQVKFRWNYVGNFDWYWSIDNIRVSGSTAAAETAMVQVLHNSADPTLDNTALYINGSLHSSSFGYLDSTPLFQIEAGADHLFEIHDGAEIVLQYTQAFEPGSSYVLTIHGLQNPNDFATNPTGYDTDAGFDALQGVYNTKPGDNVHLYFYHGVTDAPEISISLEDGTVLIDQIGYMDLHGEFIELIPDTYVFSVEDAASGAFLFDFTADLSGFQGKTAGVFATGFLNPDQNLGGHPFSLIALDSDGNITPFLMSTDIGNEQNDKPVEFSLMQNYPNPFNPVTNIRYALPEQSHVRLEVFNIAGQKVADLVNNTVQAGTHTVSFDAASLSSGVYIYRLQAGSFVETRKMILLK